MRCITATLLELINAFLVAHPYSLILFGCVILFILFFFVFFKIRNHLSEYRMKLEIVEKIEAVRHRSGYEQQLSGILELVKDHVIGEGYFLYLQDDRNHRYRLERVLFHEETGGADTSEKISVGYGRIMSYTKERYSPPIAYEHARIPETISYVKEGRYSLLIIPVPGQKGFIGISTRKRRGKRTINMLSYLALRLQDLFDSLYNQSLNLPTEIQSAENLPSSASEASIIDRIMECMISVMHGQAGLFFSMQYEYCELAASLGFSSDAEETLVNNTELFVPLTLINTADLSVKITKNSKEFELIPGVIRSEYDYFYLSRSADGFVMICYSKAPKPGVFTDYRVRMTQLLVTRATEIHNRFVKRTKEDDYLEKLRDIAGDMDNEEPYSVGYSDLMARYAIILARELELKPSEVADVEKAALLSNIGMLTIPEHIWRKKGIYSENEYEQVKTHAESGALIAGLFTGNHNVAEYIRHHHERIDGLGYPTGLKGDNIPRGARIIAVTQHFLSKVKGRNYREPLPFEKIVQHLNQEAGESLDPRIVDVLIRWFRKKQENRNLTGKTLGRCWEMRCSSEDICMKCPAYKRTDKFCWEFEDNNCMAHGNICETCYVFTEYKARNQHQEPT